jgi:hypothetical protein
MPSRAAIRNAVSVVNNTKAAGTVHATPSAALGKAIPGAMPAKTWLYPSPSGDPFAAVARFDLPGGKKTFRPVHFAGGQGWLAGDPLRPWPLYGVAAIPAAGTIYVTEGEKCADAARAIGLAAVTSAHGSSAAAKTDWASLAGRDVVIMPDNDPPGAKYARDVAGILLALNQPAKVKVVALPGLGDGGDIVDFIESRDSQTAEEIAGAIAAIADAAPIVADDLNPTPALDLVRDHPSLNPPIVEGIARACETVNFIAASKRGKTHLAMQLAVSIATGRCWLEKFPTRKSRVLYVDFELHRATFANRLAAVASAMGVTLDELDGALDVLSLRGTTHDITSLDRIFSPGRYGAIFLDAIYRAIPAGVDENSNSEMTQIWNRIDTGASRSGAAIFGIHHASKGNQSQKSAVDVGSGAGAMARAADTHLVFRQHAQDDAVVMDAAIRSFAPLESVALRWAYPLWSLAPDLSPIDLKTARPKQAAEPKPPKPEPISLDGFLGRFVTAEPVKKTTIASRARLAGVSGRRVDDLLAMAVAENRVFLWNFPKTNAVYLANREQNVTDTGTPLARAHSPHTPQPGVKPAGAGKKRKG